MLIKMANPLIKILRYGFPPDEDEIYDMSYDEIMVKYNHDEESMINILDGDYWFDYMCYCRLQEDEDDVVPGTYICTICKTRRDNNFDIKFKPLLISFKLFTKAKDYTKNK